jgi:hypothetical protein
MTSIFLFTSQVDTKRPKLAGPAELFKSSSFDEARELLARVSESYALNETTELNHVCQPERFPTWRKAELGVDLRKQRDRLRPTMICPVKAANRLPRIIVIGLGTGCGKTHLLLQAPELLGAYRIYITFNLEQHDKLRMDRKFPRQSILLRILLRLCGVANVGCGNFLSSKVGLEWLETDSETLRRFVMYRLKQLDCDICIGVDEIMQLSENSTDFNAIKAIASELGDLAHDFYQETTRMCTILVSTLDDEAFTTHSERDVVFWSPLPPDSSAIQAIVEPYSKESLDRLVATTTAAAGYHFRSIAAAAVGLKDDHAQTTVQGGILIKIHESVSVKASGDLPIIKQYVIGACKGYQKDNAIFKVHKKQLRRYLDKLGALPPALICCAFGTPRENGGYEWSSELYDVFNCDTTYVDPAKRLEQFGMRFDIFRQLHEIPVIAATATVHFPKINKGTIFKLASWYKQLIFPPNMEISEDSLFVLDAKSKVVVVTDKAKELPANAYFYPSNLSHPRIDRAFTAHHPDGSGACIVLVQDKITINNDISKAVASLNSAAEKLHEHHPSTPILLIVNVDGASESSRIQSALEHPFVLIRSGRLVDFYSASFTPIAQFARDRHTIA